MPNTLTLQDMVDAVLAQAEPGGMAKIAQEAGERVCEQCGKPAMADSKICKACAEKMSAREESRKDSEDAGSEKTSSARIQKLASAVSYIVENFSQIDRPVGRIKVAEVPTQASQTVGAGKGPQVIPTNLDAPTPGEQATVKGEAKVDTIAKSPPMASGATPKAPKNAMDDNIDTLKPAYPETGVMKQARARGRLREIVMRKFAESVDDGNAQITAPKGQSVTLPENQPSQMKRPAEVTSQESMIASSDAAINYQKTQAKSSPRKRMGEVLQEKPQNVKTVLQPVLGDVVKQANQQRAATGRALLAKIAQEGCKCNSETGECRFCKVASRLKKSQGMRKKSQLGQGGAPDPGGNPIGPGGVPSTVQSSSPIGGGSGSGTPPMM